MSHAAPLDADFDAKVLGAELPRHVLAGYLRYRNIQPIASGGKAEVKRCLDVNLGREVALKILHVRLMERSVEQRMLVREARITAALDHPAIPQVFDIGRDGDGRPYFTMPRLHGQTLHKIFEARRRGEESAQRAFPLERLLHILSEVAEAVEYAHSRNVVHCDLKPENIIVSVHGRVHLIDWGLAVVDDYPSDGDPNPAVFERGRQGSVLYMAPEQAEGAHHLGPAVDVYSLGAILYECLTHDTPCRGATAEETLENLVSADPVRPRDVAVHSEPISHDLEAVCMRAIQKSPHQRFGSITEFREALSERHVEMLLEFERSIRSLDASELLDGATHEKFCQRPTRAYGETPTPLLTN